MEQDSFMHKQLHLKWWIETISWDTSVSEPYMESNNVTGADER